MHSLAQSGKFLGKVCPKGSFLVTYKKISKKMIFDDFSNFLPFFGDFQPFWAILINLAPKMSIFYELKGVYLRIYLPILADFRAKYAPRVHF